MYSLRKPVQQLFLKHQNHMQDTMLTETAAMQVVVQVENNN